MKPVCAVALCLLASIAYAETKLESFIRRPSARVAWSEEVGRVRSAESQAIITALLVEEGSPIRQMRGIRISVSKPGVANDVYLEEEKLGVFLNTLSFIESTVTIITGTQKPRRTTVEWDDVEREPLFHNSVTASRSYRITVDADGLWVAGVLFPEPGPTSRRLMRAISRASDELKLH